MASSSNAVFDGYQSSSPWTLLPKSPDGVYLGTALEQPTSLQLNGRHVLHVGIVGGDGNDIATLMVLFTGKPLVKEETYWKAETEIMGGKVTIIFYATPDEESCLPSKLVSEIKLWLICYNVHTERKVLYKMMQSYVELCYQLKGIDIPQPEVQDSRSEARLLPAGQSESIESLINDKSANEIVSCFVISFDYSLPFQRNIRKRVTKDECRDLAEAMKAMLYLNVDYHDNWLIKENVNHSQAYLDVLLKPQSCIPPDCILD